MEGEEGVQQPQLVLAHNLFLLTQNDVDDIEKVRLRDEVFNFIVANDMAPLYETLVANKVLDLDQKALDSMRSKIDDELKKLEEKIADAEENLGESEVREAHLAKSLFYIRIGDKEKALEQLKITESKTVAIGQKMDLVFYTLQIGFFHLDFDLISKSIDKAKNLFEEGGDWERKNRLKVYEGLYCMSTRNFKKAATLFLDSISTFTTYGLFPYDTFIFYTVLTSIISLDRVSLKQKGSENDVHTPHPKMKMPKVHDSLSWGKRGSKKLSADDGALVSAAMSNRNRFSNDGNFMTKFMSKEEIQGDHNISSIFEARAESLSVNFASKENKEDAGTPSMSANQLAAKALQLRLKGKHDEAEKLLKDAENIKETQNADTGPSRVQIDGTTSRFIMHDVSARRKRKEDDGDLHLAHKITHNHRYNISNQADEEYNYDDYPRKKTRKKGGGSSNRSSEITSSANRFLTQQERCQSCFENPARPKHLVIAIANFTYLSLPHRQPVVPGRCCILTLQHESSTRTVEDNVWDEIRNFKKCLIMMFAKQEKDVVFFETVMGLAQQRRHCMVECIPLPQNIAKQAPLYFKKAIDEAEDEWSQHNAKKLIDTSEKGLRGSIPKNFPYFHVEFGLNRGFVHVIDDEKEFKSSFGLNIIRGMLRLPAKDMHRRRRHESVEVQKEVVASFVKEWEPFDWTKQL